MKTNSLTIYKEKSMLIDNATNLWYKKKNFVLTTVREIAIAIKHYTIAQLEYEAKEYLHDIGFDTDKDIHEFLTSSMYQHIIINIPDSSTSEYDNKPIIESINYSDIITAQQFVNSI